MHNIRQQIVQNRQWLGLYLLVVFVSIYSRPLIPIDETRYLSVAWEMWQSHNFLVPHINGEPYSHKPPLLFWLIHVSWLLFGVGEWSGRLVAPLFGFASVFLTVRFADVLWPEERDVAQLAPFILVGTFVWSLLSTLTMFDTLLTFFSLLALLSILQARRRKTVLPWIGYAAAIGLGILAKGPVILLYVLPPALLAPLWCRGDSPFWGRWYGFLILSLAAGFGIALCWAIPAAKAGGAEYSQAILFGQTAGRMVQSFAHGRPFYWYMLLLPLICFPWFFWLPVWRGWRELLWDNSTRFCLSVIIPALFLLSCVSGKQIHYILPILPVAALLMARIVISVPHRVRFDHLPLLLFYLVLSAALFILPQLSLHGGDRDMIKYIPKWIGVMPLACGAFLLFFRFGSIFRLTKVVSCSVLMLVIVLHLALAGSMHLIYDQSEIAGQIRKAQEEGGEVAIIPTRLTDQFQFAGRLTKPLISFGNDQIDNWVAWGEENSQQFCVIFVDGEGYKKLKGSGIARPYGNGWLIFRSAKDLFSSLKK